MRGEANAELTPELALDLGRALASRLDSGAAVLIGRDTRRSGPMLEGALAAGLASGGVDVRLAGVVPTPAVAELVAAGHASAGAVISASHNPFADNGIKFFGPDGFKLADEAEAAIEAALTDRPTRARGAAVGTIAEWPEARERYVDAMVTRFELDLTGVRVAVDCANGATFVTGPRVLERLGAQVTAIADRPDGVNINDGCGSTHLARLQATICSGGQHVGLAFDGDGDRALAVAPDGTIVDGDQILALCALRLRDRGELVGDTVVTTTMTNLGFRRAMADHGVTVRWTDVGDRYVLQEMRRGGFVLGGEQSGHLINLRVGPTGDGLATALQLLAALADRGESLARAAGVMTRLPQHLESVAVARKQDLPAATSVWEAVAAFEAQVGDDGRAVVRASGTEPLVRVMIEAPTEVECRRWCTTIAEAAVRELGVREA